MAVCGLLSIPSVSPIQPDMDACAGHSSGATRNHHGIWESGVGLRASSCLSSTMVDRNDPEDSGSSQPPTPTRTRSESKPHMVVRDSSLPGHELELSISLNDAQRSTPSRSKSVKDELDLSSASAIERDDTFVRSGGFQEEGLIAGPPRKRARMSPIGFRVEETQAENVHEQQNRHPLVSAGSGVTGMHSLLASRSLPSFRSTEREPSPSPKRGTSSGSKPPSCWWLGPGPKNAAMNPNDIQHGFQSSVQEAPRGKFSIDGRGMIPGTSLQERDFPFKEPSYYPNMLSSMETSEQVRRVEDAISLAGGRSNEQGRSQNPPDHSFFSRKESCMSRLTSTSAISEETVPRPGSAFFANKRDICFLPDDSSLYGHQKQQLQHQFEQRASPQGDQRSLHGLPGGNANTTFYARILDAGQQPASSPFSEGGHPSAFNLAGQPLRPRSSSQAGVGPAQFGSESTNSNPAHQQANSEALRNLLAPHPSVGPSVGSVPAYMPQQVPNPDPVRLSFPNLSSLNFLQSLQQQRQSFPPQGPDRHRQFPLPGHMPGTLPPPQGFPFLGAPQSSQHSLPAESNPPPLHLRGSQTGSLQVSAGFRDFLSSDGSKGASSLGVGRGCRAGPQEIPTHLSLQALAPPPSLTVVMEGRSIGRRISLNDYSGYDNFAVALRAMVDSHVASKDLPAVEGNCTLENAIPGYAIAYEDEEGDVLLAGDLPWRNFIRIARQIRIIPSSKIRFKLPTGPPRP